MLAVGTRCRRRCRGWSCICLNRMPDTRHRPRRCNQRCIDRLSLASWLTANSSGVDRRHTPTTRSVVCSFLARMPRTGRRWVRCIQADTQRQGQPFERAASRGSERERGRGGMRGGERARARERARERESEREREREKDREGERERERERERKREYLTGSS